MIVAQPLTLGGGLLRGQQELHPRPKHALGPSVGAGWPGQARSAAAGRPSSPDGRVAPPRACPLPRPGGRPLGPWTSGSAAKRRCERCSCDRCWRMRWPRCAVGCPPIRRQHRRARAADLPPSRSTTRGGSPHRQSCVRARSAAPLSRRPARSTSIVDGKIPRRRQRWGGYPPPPSRPPTRCRWRHQRRRHCSSHWHCCRRPPRPHLPAGAPALRWGAAVRTLPCARRSAPPRPADTRRRRPATPPPAPPCATRRGTGGGGGGGCTAGRGAR